MRDDGSSILQPEGETVLDGRRGEDVVDEVDGVLLGKAKAVIVILLLSVYLLLKCGIFDRISYICVHVVGIDGVTSHLRCSGNTALHNAGDVRALQIQPKLAGPALELCTLILGSEFVGIRTTRLIRTGAEVANDLLADLMQGVDLALVLAVVGVGEKVEVQNLYVVHERRVVDIDIDLREKNNFPRGAGRWLPNGSTLST